jgi:hypothetical protein
VVDVAAGPELVEVTRLDAPVLVNPVLRLHIGPVVVIE